MLNSSFNDVEFPNKQIKECSANVIAKNIITRVCSDAFLVTLLQDIKDHKKDGSVVKMDNKNSIPSKGEKVAYEYSRMEAKSPLNDGIETWTPLKDFKEHNPVELSKFFKARGM